VLLARAYISFAGPTCQTPMISGYRLLKTSIRTTKRCQRTCSRPSLFMLPSTQPEGGRIAHTLHITFQGSGSQNMISRTIMSTNSSRFSKIFHRRRRETKGEGLRTHGIYQFRIGCKQDEQAEWEGRKRTGLFESECGLYQGRGEGTEV
jgi:hypothetical protein